MRKAEQAAQADAYEAAALDFEQEGYSPEDFRDPDEMERLREYAEERAEAVVMDLEDVSGLEDIIPLDRRRYQAEYSVAFVPAYLIALRDLNDA